MGQYDKEVAAEEDSLKLVIREVSEERFLVTSNEDLRYCSSLPEVAEHIADLLLEWFT